jgi:hypothetical protein
MNINFRTPFAPQFNFVVKHPFTFNGRDYERGEDFDKAQANDRLLQALYEQNKLDAVVPSIIIQEPAAKPVVQPAKAKPGRKPKAEAEEPMAGEPEQPTNRYRIAGNFGTMRIMDGDTVVRECASLDEAKAAMAELSGE